MEADSDGSLMSKTDFTNPVFFQHIWGKCTSNQNWLNLINVSPNLC